MLASSSKNWRGPTVHVDYLIHIQEIKCWPPSQSLISVRSALIQWENGERSSGSTNTVSPNLGSAAVEVKIEFNETFKLHVNLVKDISVKGKDGDVFMKNVLKLNLYEPQREKIQLLGTAIVNLVEYGIIKETLDITVPMTSKRSISNTAQPILSLKIDRVYKGRNGASSRGNRSHEQSLDRKGSETVSALMDEENAEEDGVASFTDDDVSSHSSLAASSSTLESNGGSLPQNEENGEVGPIDVKGEIKEEHALASESHLERTNVGTQITQSENYKGTSYESSVDACASASNSYSSTSPVRDNVLPIKFFCLKIYLRLFKESGVFSDSPVHGEDDRKAVRNGKFSSKEATAAADECDDSLEGNFGHDWQENGHEGQYNKRCCIHIEGKKKLCSSERVNATVALLLTLIMEQCVARLDVAMFNAVLRDSGDEIPTDPVSDPISDLLVLPIPAGKASFGAGAQLKNAIRNWSRWLTDLFGIYDENDQDGSDERQDTSVKSFHLLNALSDLMMLPKDMLLSRPIREEVCPTFGPTLIKRVIDYFVPDKFCPDPVPDVVLEALEAEDPAEAREVFVANFPCVASPPVYSPASASSVANIIGEVGSQSQLRRSGSSVLKKSYTSDNELDELNAPLASIFMDGFQSSPVLSKPNWISKGNGYQNAIRYELLRYVWMKSK
ncbi:hypothetical protein like AT3G01810 [Hibiscus trionum]|uniref:C2 NT-type domain-containing protein n=1 Tax=Hibiscus trionum TaxID=183268 RepID=A0A9W7M8B7_HIBTR|nr:hypothetical protein like AT3G01810 [Hibiscus trionum]